MTGTTIRGLSEREVWQAADALLAEGSRPTIERVRARVGRGSPNTVSLHLESWFGGLSARIADPAAFAASGGAVGWPPSVAEAFAAVWATAAQAADAAADERLAAARRAAAAEVEHARAELAQANESVVRRYQELVEVKAQHAAALHDLLAARLGMEGLERRASDLEAHLGGMRAKIDRDRQLAAEAMAAAVAERDAAQGRADAADRRVAAELERERQLRAVADRRAADADRRMQALTETLAGREAELGRARSDAAVAVASAETARAGERRAVEAASESDQRCDALRAELARAQAALDAAVSSATAGTGGIASLSPRRAASAAPTIGAAASALRRSGLVRPPRGRRPARQIDSDERRWRGRRN